MEIYFIIGLLVVVGILFSLVSSAASKKRKIFKNNTYSYTAKSSLMTRAEGEFS